MTNIVTAAPLHVDITRARGMGSTFRGMVVTEVEFWCTEAPAITGFGSCFNRARPMTRFDWRGPPNSIPCNIDNMFVSVGPSLTFCDMRGFTAITNMTGCLQGNVNCVIDNEQNIDTSGCTDFSNGFRDIASRPRIGLWSFASFVNGVNFLAGTGTDEYDQWLSTLTQRSHGQHPVRWIWATQPLTQATQLVLHPASELLTQA